MDMLILSIVRVDAHLIYLPARDNRFLQVPLQELGKPLLQLGTDNDLEYRSVEKRPTLVILVVGFQHNLLVWPPQNKFEWSSTYRCVCKVPSRLFHLLLRYHRSIGEPQDD